MSFQVTKWLKFFKDAGIPSGHATNYAMTFCDHRIQDSMLPDINKEILKDMDITVMGDIISILKHAREVHAQSEREKMASQMSATEAESGSCTLPGTVTPPDTQTLSGTVTPPDTQTLSDTVTPPGSKRKATAASRMVDHWISNVRASTGTRGTESPTPPTTKLTIQVSDESRSKTPVKTLSLSERFSGVGGKKIKVSPPTGVASTEIPKNIVTVKKKHAATVVAKAKSVKKQSVFERLGEEVPTSTTSTQKGNASKTKTITEPGVKQLKNNFGAIQRVKGTSSVFSRLGDKNEPPSTATTTVRVIPIRRRTEGESSEEEEEEEGSSIDYTSYSVLSPPKSSSYSCKLTSDSMSKNKSKPVKHVKPVKRTVGIVSSTTDTSKTPATSRSVFARLGSKV